MHWLNENSLATNTGPFVLGETNSESSEEL